MGLTSLSSSCNRVCKCVPSLYFTWSFLSRVQPSVNALLTVCFCKSHLQPLIIGCQRIVHSVCECVSVWVYVCLFKSSASHRGIPLPSFAVEFKKNTRRLPQSAAPSSLSASSLHRSHSSCVPERSARLISARLCVSCRVSPKALLAPLAQAAVRFQTAWADGCLPNQSALLSLISIFQTSIYFPLASQDQNSAELIIKGLLSSTFIFSHLLLLLWKQSWFPSFRLWLDVNAEWTFSDSPLPQVGFNSTHFEYKMINLGLN